MRPCARCGAKSSATWNARICAVGRKVSYRLCARCDVELNRTVLSFFRDPDVDVTIAAYAAEKGVSA